MIRANELRKNNLVKDRGGKILRIDWLENGKVCQDMGTYNAPPFGQVPYHPLTEDFEFLQPIKLTEDILLKCPQFVFDDMEDTNEENTWFWFKHRSIAFGSDKSSNFNFVVIRINKEEIIIKYLHDLQNKVYEFTGTELEINL